MNCDGNSVIWCQVRSVPMSPKYPKSTFPRFIPSLLFPNRSPTLFAGWPWTPREAKDKKCRLRRGKWRERAERSHAEKENRPRQRCSREQRSEIQIDPKRERHTEVEVGLSVQQMAGVIHALSVSLSHTHTSRPPSHKHSLYLCPPSSNLVTYKFLNNSSLM